MVFITLAQHCLSTLYYAPSLWQLREPLQETAHLYDEHVPFPHTELELAIMLPLDRGTNQSEL